MDHLMKLMFIGGLSGKLITDLGTTESQLLNLGVIILHGLFRGVSEYSETCYAPRL